MAALLHVYRRLGPGPIGADNRPATIHLVRATLEAAIQKFGASELCDWIANSVEIQPSQILCGALVKSREIWERAGGEDLTRKPQLVLKDFGRAELAEFYQLEKLAYELWKSAAVLRAIGKGGPLRVLEPTVLNGELFADDRSPELNTLLERYDCRDAPAIASATA